jgi:type IV pilus assembly protein PilZ
VAKESVSKDVAVVGEENKQGILSLTIKDRAVLYAAYMPFVRNGGLFVPTNKRYELGEEVSSSR